MARLEDVVSELANEMVNNPNSLDNVSTADATELLDDPNTVDNQNQQVLDDMYGQESVDYSAKDTSSESQSYQTTVYDSSDTYSSNSSGDASSFVGFTVILLIVTAIFFTRNMWSKKTSTTKKEASSSDGVATDAINILSKKADADTLTVYDVNAKNHHSELQISPFQQALQYSKKPAIGVVVIALIGSVVGGKGGGEVVPLMLAMFAGLAFVVFPVLWLLLYLKEKNIVGNWKHGIKESVVKFNDNPNPDLSDVHPLIRYTFPFVLIVVNIVVAVVLVPIATVGAIYSGLFGKKS